MTPAQDSVRSAGVPPASNLGSGETHLHWRSRGYLPHLDAPNLIQHVVFRLADSLPAGIREDLTGKPPHDRVLAIDAALDQGHGGHHLAIPAIAEMAQTALLTFDAKRYALLAWCVMPNHVHTLLETRPSYALDRIVHSWKSYTAKQANQLVGQAGAFWAREYFDRYMRNGEHLAKTAAYIESNPVKAGLCENVSDWPFSSAWQGWAGGTPAVPNSPVAP